MTTLGVHKGRILVRYAPREMTPIMSNLPGVTWDSNLSSWSMPLGVSTGRQVLALFPQADQHESFESVTERIVREDRAADAKVCPIEELPEIPKVGTTPWSHQLRAFWFLFHKLGLSTPDPSGGALLAMDMGTGKTKVSIDLIQNSVPRTVLITCPLAVVPTWPEEFEKHYSGGTGVRMAILDRGTVAKRTQEAKRVIEQAAGLGQMAVIVINHESVWRSDFRKLMLSQRPDLLIVDESHRAKDPGGQLSKFLALLHSRVPTRVGLTGTPMPKDHLDLYAQARFLDNSYFGTSWAAHKAQFANWTAIDLNKKSRAGKPIVIQKLVSIRNRTAFEERLDSLTYRVMADDVLDLPPAQFMQRTCELSSKERRAYDEFKKELIVELEGGVLSADNALVKLLRLQQIVQGYVETDDGVPVQIGDSKQRLLREVLTDLDREEPVVVFCKFHTDLDAVASVAAKLDRGCLELSGRVNQLQEFKKGGGPIIAVQIQSGGVGVDLSRAAYSIYYSPTYDMGAYDQSVRRTRRPTKHQHDKFFYYHLVAKNTVDVAIYAALRSKKNLVEAVLSSIKGAI